jgi:chemotaxis protein histidine kinase CheA
MTNSASPVRIHRNPSNLKNRVRVLDVPEERTAIYRAEKALEEAAVEFAKWQSDMIAILSEEAKRIERGEHAPMSDTPLFRAAFNIKGQADSIGFGSVGYVAKLLCDYLENQTELTANGLSIVHQCVETIGAMNREDVRTLEHPIAGPLVEALKIFIVKKQAA